MFLMNPIRFWAKTEDGVPNPPDRKRNVAIAIQNPVFTSPALSDS
jgi:hypothetical protein